MTEVSQEVIDNYSFPEDLTILDEYIEKRDAQSAKNFDYTGILDHVPGVTAFCIGSVFAYRTMTPHGSAARLLKEKRQGRGVYYMNRLIPLVSFGYFAWSLRNKQYRPNPYSTGYLP